MPSKINHALLLFVTAQSLAWAAEPPAALPVERYQPLIVRSPFALASENAAPAVASDAAGFAKDLVLTGVARVNGGEYVTLVSRDQSQRFGLMKGEIYNGITLASVAWSDTVGKTRVTLKRGHEYGVIGFDEAAGPPVASPAPKNPSAEVNPAQRMSPTP